MEFKTYKVGEIYQNQKYVPSIRLNGKWLEELNFSVGEQVVVYQDKDILVIKKPSEEEQKILENQRKEKERKRLQKQLKAI